MENLSNDIKTIINTAYPYIKEFNPAQKAVIESGYLEDKSNYIISIPTASGKTVLGILPALKTILNGGKAIYAAPLLSIQNEKVKEFKAFEEHAFDYLLKPIDEARLEKTLARLRLERSKQDVSLLPENQQALKFIPCTGHSRIYLLQMKDVAFVSSRMSGVYVTSHEGKEGFTELTLRTLESRTPLLRCHRQYLVNLAHLQEIRLEDNGQAELILRNGLTVPVSRRYLKSLKEAIGL